MQATTHIDLEERCAEEGIGFHVIPGLTATALAVSLSGLQSYRFGRQVTIPFSDGNYLPTSPFEMICRNIDAGMHTLALLDLDPTGMGLEQPRPMTPGEAVDHLVRMNERSEVFDESVEDWNGLLLSDLGTEEEKGCFRYNAYYLKNRRWAYSCSNHSRRIQWYGSRSFRATQNIRRYDGMKDKKRVEEAKTMAKPLLKFGFRETRTVGRRFG